MWYLKVRTRPCAHCLAAAGMEPSLMTKRDVTRKSKFLLLVRGKGRGGRGGENGRGAGTRPH